MLASAARPQRIGSKSCGQFVRRFDRPARAFEPSKLCLKERNSPEHPKQSALPAPLSPSSAQHPKVPTTVRSRGSQSEPQARRFSTHFTFSVALEGPKILSSPEDRSRELRAGWLSTHITPSFVIRTPKDSSNAEDRSCELLAGSVQLSPRLSFAFQDPKASWAPKFTNRELPAWSTTNQDCQSLSFGHSEEHPPD